MLYLDDEARDDFHSSSTLLQVVCSLLDGLLYKHGLQAELLMAEAHKAYVGLHDCPVDIGRIIVSELNAQCQRHDKKPTADWLDEPLGILLIQVTKAKDLTQVM